MNVVQVEVRENKTKPVSKILQKFEVES